MTFVFPDTEPGYYRVYSQSGEFLALSRADEGKLTTLKSFYNV